MHKGDNMNIKELYDKKEKLEREIIAINNNIRLDKLNEFIRFLHTQRKRDMLSQDFEIHHDMMETIVNEVDKCLEGTETKASYENYAQIIIDGEYNLSDKQDFICLSDDRCYLYDVISFFEEEANKRKENKIEDVWINNDRLDKFLLNITYVLDIDLDWYDLYREV